MFESGPVQGISEMFSLALSPLSADAHTFGLRGLKDMSEANVWRYLRVVVDGVNRLTNFLNDPRNFADANGVVDLLKQAQAYSAASLLFADIAGLNFSTRSHNRVSYAMSALDKLANLRVHVGNAGASEGEAMMALASKSQQDQLTQLLRRELMPHSDSLAQSFSEVVNRAYEAVHAHLAKQDPAAETSERARLERVRLQRNIRHGAFLNRDGFDKLFLRSDGTVPADLATIPFVLVLGLILDPKVFLSFNPTV